MSRAISDTVLVQFQDFLRTTKDLLTRIHGDKALHRELRSREHQELWEYLHMLSLFGLNMVSGGHLPESGEEVSLTVLDAAFPQVNVNIVDIGANNGDYTALALEMLKGRANIWAFEPLPGNFTSLQSRFAGVSSVSTVQSAVGKECGELPFFVNADSSTIGSLVPRDLEHEGTTMLPRVKVPVVTLDEWTKSKGVDHIHLLKIDVEGADLDVLLGSRDLLAAGKISLIQFEFSAAQIDARHYFKDFFGLLTEKYRLYRIVGDGVIEIGSYNERYEVFSCINYLAVIRD